VGPHGKGDADEEAGVSLSGSAEDNRTYRTQTTYKSYSPYRTSG
jgi:hypothetical protein